MAPFPSTTPLAGQLFRHVDGGLYRFTGTARDSRDTAPLYLYEHLWPFEAQSWARPAHEWASRFEPISHEDVATALQGDRRTAQMLVQQAKAVRRAGAAS